MPGCTFCGGPVRRLFDLPHTSVWECLVEHCRLRFASPQLASGVVNQAYRELYYPGNQGTPTYESTPPTVLRQALLQLRRQVGDLTGWSLLDYGCGRGVLCGIARELGLKATGIEADPIAREEVLGTGSLDVFEGLESLSAKHPHRLFDLVVMWEVIEHLREPWVDLKRLVRFMRPGGVLLISTPNSNCLKARLLGPRWDNFRNPTHLFYFTATSLHRTLAGVGLMEITEWRARISYPGHGRMRSAIHRALVAFGAHGALLFRARKSAVP